MANRLISLFLVFVMLFGIIVSTASCTMLEEFVGEENLGEDYMNKYYPDRNQAGNDDSNSGTTNKPVAGTVVPVSQHDPDVPREEGCNLITFFWNSRTWTKSAEALAKCDIWCWWDGGEGGGRMMKLCEYGAMLTLNVPKDVKEVGFIIRTDCTDPGGTSWGSANKDCGDDDLFATIEGDDTFIYMKSGKSDQYHRNPTTGVLEVIQKFNLAGMVGDNKIEYIITPTTKFTSMDQFKVYDGDREIKISNVSSLGRSATTGVITVDEKLDITKTYTVKIDGFEDSRNVVPTDIFDTADFASKYHYDGDDLGAVINGDKTTFKVWAPTASKVVLNLFKQGDTVDAYKSVDMKLGEKGVWSYTEECGHGTYYTYSVTTAVGTQEAVDPYAKAAGLNGNRGMVVDLSLTDPDGWDADQSFYVKDTDGTPIDSYNDAVIWEIHVRDFSNEIDFGSDEANEKYRGKYLAFTQDGLTTKDGIPIGIDYLKALGVNFVHILPMYDYATVKEENPDSGFNWGYDPKNYNVPEGSYSTDPYNGAVRINELKQMVMALHEAGIGVVMDVVYNHTYDKNASFNRIVPYYYYRYKPNGANSSGSGCGNDTASERYMYGKFMVESTEYWMEEYNLDGFRFDLMGLHDTKTMQKIESTIHTMNPQALLYGEGWDMIQNSYNTSLHPASQKYISEVKPTGQAIGGIAVFNDVIRTGLKKEDNDGSKGYVNGSAGDYERNRVLFGVNGGNYAMANAGWKAEVVNYMSAHDGCTFWDKLSIANGGSSKASRLAMNRLGATIIFVSKGMVFFQAGEEMLRSKAKTNDSGKIIGYDHNSYKSSDAINNLKWSALTPTSEEYKMFQYYAGLCAIRTKIDIFSNAATFKTDAHGYDKGFNIKMSDGKGGNALVIVNPGSSPISNFSLDGITYELICDGTRAGITSLKTCTGSVNVPAGSAYILVTKNLLP